MSKTGNVIDTFGITASTTHDSYGMQWHAMECYGMLWNAMGQERWCVLNCFRTVQCNRLRIIASGMPTHSRLKRKLDSFQESMRMKIYELLKHQYASVPFSFFFGGSETTSALLLLFPTPSKFAFKVLDMWITWISSKGNPQDIPDFTTSGSKLEYEKMPHSKSDQCQQMINISLKNWLLTTDWKTPWNSLSRRWRGGKKHPIFNCKISTSLQPFSKHLAVRICWDSCISRCSQRVQPNDQYNYPLWKTRWMWYQLIHFLFHLWSNTIDLDPHIIIFHHIPSYPYA
jgi:hypothetical protein